MQNTLGEKGGSSDHLYDSTSLPPEEGLTPIQKGIQTNLPKILTGTSVLRDDDFFGPIMPPEKRGTS